MCTEIENKTCRLQNKAKSQAGISVVIVKNISTSLDSIRLQWFACMAAWAEVGWGPSSGLGLMCVTRVEALSERSECAKPQTPVCLPVCQVELKPLPHPHSRGHQAVAHEHIHSFPNVLIARTEYRTCLCTTTNCPFIKD